ncbi:MAG TPA: FHA domain-containing protein, partial [Archangium sp.]
TDDIQLEGLPHALLTLACEGSKVTVIAQRSVRVGETLFPARVPRLLLEGEDLKLPNDVVLRRVIDAKRRDSRRQMATAFVAKGLLEGDVAASETKAATLTCVTGLDRGRVYPIAFEENVIGRADDAPIRIKDRSVSRQHALLVRKGERFVLQVIESAMNGIYVNGLLLKGDRELKTGDTIELGQTILRFEGAPERTVVSGPIDPKPVEVPKAASPAPALQLSWWDALPDETWLMGGGLTVAVLAMLAASLAW